MRSLLFKRFRLLPYDVHPVHFAFHFNNTSHEPSCIRTYDFYQIHFSLHFQSVSECIPIPITIPYRATPPKDLPDPCSLVCVPLCTYGLRRLTGRGTCTSNMYFQTIPPKIPPGSSCWKRNFPPGIQKDFFGGVLNWWPRRVFLGMSGLYAFIRTSLIVHPLIEEDVDIPYCTYLPT